MLVPMFEFFIARRYLRAKRKQVMISVITLISVIGVAAGVMALVIGMAVTSGFRRTLERNLLGATSDVMILEKEREGISGWEQLAEKLSHLPHVKSAMPGLYDGGLLAGPLDSTLVQIKGISVQPGASLPDALLHLKQGSAEGLRTGDDELPGIILGALLAEKVGAVNGKPVTLIVPKGKLTPFGIDPKVVQLRVVGIFESGFFDFDSTWGIMSLAATQQAFNLDDVVNSVELKLDDIYRAPEVAAATEPLIGPNLAATTWQEQYKQQFDALRMEKVVTAITIGLIQIVAALNILIALVMMVMEKHRDIAILMSLGARAQQIRRIFVLEGALIGVVGTSIGLILGYTICYLANRYKWLPLNEEVYSMSFVPFEPRWVDGIWIAATAIGISLLATLYPARSATRIAPVEALRYE
jgi:lipoprotein-releasing system permease protein